MSEDGRQSDLTRVMANVAAVRQQIADAAQASGRSADQVRLVAVTKYLTPAQTRLLIQAGCHDLGESRPQQLWEKASSLADARPRWHLIGHLQRNKANRTLPLVHLVHSVDSTRLWQTIHDWAVRAGTRLDGLIEINISGDASKHGFDPDQVFVELDQLAAHSVAQDATVGLRILGLMGMASLEGGPDQAQRDFARLRQLRDQLAQRFPELSRWSELSMGMSGDFEQAILEGATIVRIGSALVEGIV